MTEPGMQGKRQEEIEMAFHAYLEKYTGEMLTTLDRFRAGVQQFGNTRQPDRKELKKLFLDLRKAYKRIEPFSCYYFLASERNFNGPVVPEIEDEDEIPLRIEYPHGLQKMETCLWQGDAENSYRCLLDEIDLMHGNLSALRIAFRTVPTDEVKFLEAIQLQVIRIFTLGVSQFDTPLSKNFLEETQLSFQSLIEALTNAYCDEGNAPLLTNVLRQLNNCLSYFQTVYDPDRIDFVECYQKYYVPLSRSLVELRTEFAEKNYYPSSALRLTAGSIFETDAFNRFFYNPRGTDPQFSSEAAALGKALFFDPILSSNNKRSCASCHQPDRAFTDGQKTSQGFLLGEELTRNAPTLINAALQRNYFYDSRADHLEGQIGHVLANKSEMQSSFNLAATKLRTSPEYVEWFHRAFNGTADTVISRTSIENAISEYERTLVSLNSRFDRNIRGDENTFTAEERKGFNVFMNKGRCATCHYLPLLNNVVPPQYTRSEFEIIGTTSTSDLEHPVLDPDEGRGGLHNVEVFKHAFKTTTLRNIALTAPYMHNGAFEDLKQVVEFYNRGGGAGLGLDVPNQTLPADSLGLTEKEKTALIAFLHTLTDTANLTSWPGRLPQFPDSSLNKRMIGGEY